MKDSTYKIIVIILLSVITCCMVYETFSGTKHVKSENVYSRYRVTSDGMIIDLKDMRRILPPVERTHKATDGTLHQVLEAE